MTVHELENEHDDVLAMKVERPQPLWNGWKRLDSTLSLAASWDIPTIRSFRSGEAGWKKTQKSSDHPWLNGGANVCLLSHHAADRLDDLLHRYGELLPVDCDEGEFHVYHCTNLLDALDEERSEGRRGERTGQFMVHKFAFKPDVIRGQDIFRIAGPERYRIFVSESFVNRAKQAGLRGLLFKPIWTDDPAIAPAPSTVRRATSSSPLPKKSEKVFAQAIAQAEEMLLVDLAYTPSAEIQQKIQEMIDSNSPARGQTIAQASLVAATLGTLWGEVVCREFGWEWAWVRQGDAESAGIVSPTRSHVIFPQPYFYELLARRRSPSSLKLYEMLKTSSVPASGEGDLLVLS